MSKKPSAVAKHETNEPAMTLKSLSPISVMLYCVLGFIAFDVLVSLYDTVPVVVRGTTVCHAFLFGLAFAGAAGSESSWQRQRWPRVSFFLAAAIACLGAVAIIVRLGPGHWLPWIAAIFLILPLFLTILGVCRVIDQLVPRLPSEQRTQTLSPTRECLPKNSRDL